MDEYCTPARKLAITGIVAKGLQPKRCVLCARKAFGIGIFVPDEPWNYTARPPAANAERAFVYSLCPKHERQFFRSQATQHAVALRVEAVIEAGRHDLVIDIVG